MFNDYIKKLAEAEGSFNTTFVLVLVLDSEQASGNVGRFQYNICFGSSMMCIKCYIFWNLFQYNICFGSRCNKLWMWIYIKGFNTTFVLVLARQILLVLFLL